MRPIDADKIVLNYGGLIHISPLDGRAISKYFYDQIQAMPTIAPPPNDPLTLEQLLEMEGEPVYCISDYEITVNGEKGHRSHSEGWGIVTGTDLGDQGFIVGTAYIYYLEHYGKTWLAYRRKPEEG